MSTPFLGSALGNMPWGFCFIWGFLGGITHSFFAQDQVSTTLLTASCKLPFSESWSPQRAPLGLGRNCCQHSIPCFSFFHLSPCQPFPIPFWRAVSFPPGLSAFISLGNDFLSLSTKAQEESNWPFIHNWPLYGMGCSGSRSKCSPELT